MDVKSVDRRVVGQFEIGFQSSDVVWAKGLHSSLGKSWEAAHIKTSLYRCCGNHTPPRNRDFCPGNASENRPLNVGLPSLHERGPVSAMFVSRDREKLINAIIYFLGDEALPYAQAF
jgi:hypothetical protein